MFDDIFLLRQDIIQRFIKNFIEKYRTGRCPGCGAGEAELHTCSLYAEITLDEANIARRLLGEVIWPENYNVRKRNVK